MCTRYEADIYDTIRTNSANSEIIADERLIVIFILIIVRLRYNLCSGMVQRTETTIWVFEKVAHRRRVSCTGTPDELGKQILKASQQIRGTAQRNSCDSFYAVPGLPRLW